VSKTTKAVCVFLSMMLLWVGIASYASAAGSPPGSAVSESDISKYDITNTPRGTSIVQKTVADWTEMGLLCDGGGVRVYEFSPGSFLITSVRPSQIRFEYVKGKKGQSEVQPVVSTSSSDSFSTAGGASVMGAPYPVIVDQWCPYRIENSTGWIDHCYRVSKVYDDGDSIYDHFTLEHWATAKSKGAYYLKNARIYCAKKAGSTTTFYWTDWSPRSDLNLSCQSISLTVTSGPISISGDIYQACETWDITKYAEAGKFKNEWKGSKKNTDREVAYMVSVKVPQGKWASWDLTAGITTSLAP